MKPLRIYFAGRWAATEETARTVKHRLISHAYPSHFKRWMEMNPENPGEIILDSGAFSAWNRGDELDINEYIESAHEVIEKAEAHNKKVHVTNLDVIPGEVGSTKELNKILGSKESLARNQDIINKAAKEGFDNMKRMIDSGITPIHVYHQGEDWIWLDRMLEYTDYIGISPANDLSQNDKYRWMHRVFDYLYNNGVDVKTHGFAVTAIQSIKDLPWYSCDSTTWRLFAGYGKILLPREGFSSGKPILSTDDFELIPVSDRQKGSPDFITEGKRKVLERDGYTNEDLQSHVGRAEINLRFFLKLQEDLNTYKQKTRYEPIKTLI